MKYRDSEEVIWKTKLNIVATIGHKRLSWLDLVIGVHIREQIT